MLLNADQVAAFGDWLERDRIRLDLIAARPELADRIELDDARPLLRILRPRRAAVLVARTDAVGSSAWVVGVPDRPAPRVHDAPTREVLVRRVLEALEDAGAPADEGADSRSR